MESIARSDSLNTSSTFDCLASLLAIVVGLGGVFSEMWWVARPNTQHCVIF